MLLADIAHRGATLAPGGTAWAWSGRTRTHAQSSERVRRLAGHLQASGVRDGSRVVVLSTNVPEVLELLCAASLTGAVVVPLNARLAPDEMRAIADDAQPELAVVHPSLEAAGRDAGLLDRPTWLLDEGWECRLSSASAGPLPARPSPESPVLQLYTSGTTGCSKGCLLSSRALLASVANTALGLDLQPGERLLGVFPFFHVAGLGFALATTAYGGTVVCPPAADPATLWQQVEEHSCTLAGLPGGRATLEHPSAATASSSLRAVVGGANMETPLHALRTALLPHVRWYGVYGSTEGGNLVSVTSTQDEQDRPGTIGRPLPGFAVTVLGDDDADQPAGSVGELALRGSSLMSGYAGRQEATAEALRGGWLHTGDLVRLDEEGYLYFVDRDKDMIKSGGENVYSIEVERVLLAHADVLDAAVVGVPDRRWGEAVKAVVVRRPGTDVQPEELSEFCRQHIGRFKVPRWYEFVDVVPRSLLGKVLKRELRDAHDDTVAVRLAERS